MWKVLILPFSWLYGFGLRVRHLLYDAGLLRSNHGAVPSLVVGNLCAGGSGKTPHMLKFAGWLSTDFKIATLSRGYGRKTSGFRFVACDSDASDVGDEPLLLKKNLPEIPVAVCENRLAGIEWLAASHPDCDVVLLDDAYQHRALKPDISILLIPYADLVGNRFLLPAGNQRDLWSRYKKADIIIITRCPNGRDTDIKLKVSASLPTFLIESVFLSRIENQAVWSFDAKHPTELTSANFSECILVTGIAGAKRLKYSLERKGIAVTHFEFPDHHAYSDEDVNKIMQACGQKHPIFTTGKDRVKIELLLNPDLKANWFELSLELMFDREEDLKKLILQHVTKHKRSR